MNHPMRGISPIAFQKLCAEVAGLARVLSDDQLLDLADNMHTLIRENRSVRPPGRVTFVYAGLNDNRPLTGQPGDRVAPPLP